MAKRITPEEVEGFIVLYQAGKNTPEISELTGRSLRAVCYSLKDAGIDLRAEQPHQTSPEVEEQAFSLYEQGYLRIEIAKALGLWDTTVGSILRRRLGHAPDWDDSGRRAKRAQIWGNPDNQPARTSRETEDLILALYRGGTGWNEIAAKASVSVKSVSNILIRRGIPVTRSFKTDAQQRRTILELLAAGSGIAEIASTVNLTEDAVKLFTAHGRTSVFSKIDTPEAAYWYGFLNADGAIVGVGPGTLRLQVALARKDRAHLVKLREFLGAQRDVWDYEAKTIGGIVRPYSSLICQERPVVIDLARLGILPNKTGAEKPWTDAPANLIRHYWRGMVDGDGSVPGKSFTITLAGSYEVSRAFACWANRVGGSAVNPTQDKRSPNHWRVIIGSRSTIPALLRELYADAPVSLDRKQEIADRLMATGD